MTGYFLENYDCRAIVKGHRKIYNISIRRHWGTAERKKLTYET